MATTGFLITPLQPGINGRPHAPQRTRLQHTVSKQLTPNTLGKSVVVDIEFDVTENETHRATAKATTHPVEDGADVSDHVRPDPITLDLVARISNTPIEATREDAEKRGEYFAEASYEKLLAMKDAGEPIDVVTALKRYTSMVITSISVTRNASTGGVLALTLSLQQIRIVGSETIEAPPLRPRGNRGKKPVEQGKQPTEAAPEAVAQRSETILLKYGRKAFKPLDAVLKK